MVALFDMPLCTQDGLFRLDTTSLLAYVITLIVKLITPDDARPAVVVIPYRSCMTSIQFSKDHKIHTIRNVGVPQKVTEPIHELHNHYLYHIDDPNSNKKSFARDSLIYSRIPFS